jgi:hypothetical protein
MTTRFCRPHPQDLSILSHLICLFAGCGNSGIHAPVRKGDWRQARWEERRRGGRPPSLQIKPLAHVCAPGLTAGVCHKREWAAKDSGSRRGLGAPTDQRLRQAYWFPGDLAPAAAPAVRCGCFLTPPVRSRWLAHDARISSPPKHPPGERRIAVSVCRVIRWLSTVRARAGAGWRRLRRRGDRKAGYRAATSTLTRHTLRSTRGHKLPLLKRNQQNHLSLDMTSHTAEGLAPKVARQPKEKERTVLADFICRVVLACSV